MTKKDKRETCYIELDDGREVEIKFYVHPAEPDVGIVYPYTEIDEVLDANTKKHIELTPDEWYAADLAAESAILEDKEDSY